MSGDPHEHDRTLMQLARGAWTLAALGRLAGSGTLARLRGDVPAAIEDEVERADAAVLAEAGLVIRDGDRWRAAGALAGSRLADDPAAVAGWVGSQLGQAGRHAAGVPAGWASPEPDVLRGQGRASAMWPARLASEVFPRLDGTADAFAAGGRFLDVGTGVAALAIAFCTQFPAARVVGLDVFAPALAVAREDVAAAGLADRLELREQSVAELQDREAFDLVWLPQPFIPRVALEAGLAAIRNALRPGGWLIMAVAGAAATPFDELAALLQGGGPLAVPDALALLGAHGFQDATQLTVSVPIPLVAARRPPA